MGENRERVLTAARAVFLEKGYQGASLETIADEAGFSKGVVYSQFESKADLFLALLERRIAERASRNAGIAAGARGAEGVLELIAAAEHDSIVETRWAELLIDFRIHAARDPAIGNRYARAHARTIDALMAALSRVHENGGIEPAIPVRVMAQLILALASGVVLERATEADSLPLDVLRPAVLRLLALDHQTPQPTSARPVRKEGT